MRYTNLVGTAIGLLGLTSVLAQDRILEPKRAVRDHIAWLVALQFELEGPEAAKLKSALTTVPPPSVGDLVWAGTADEELTPIEILDEALVSRQFILALAEVLTRPQLTALFDSVQTRKDRAARAFAQWIGAVIDPVLNVAPEQREFVGLAWLAKLMAADQTRKDRAARALVKRRFGAVIEPISDVAPAKLIAASRLYSKEPLEGRKRISSRWEIIHGLLLSGDVSLEAPGFELSDRQREVWRLAKNSTPLMQFPRSRMEDPLRIEAEEIAEALEFEENPNGRNGAGAILPRPVVAANLQDAMEQLRRRGYNDQALGRIVGRIRDTKLWQKVTEEERQDKVREYAEAVIEAHLESFVELDDDSSRRLSQAVRETLRQWTEEEQSKAFADRTKRDSVRSNEANSRAGARQADRISQEQEPEPVASSLWGRLLHGIENSPLIREAVEKILSREARGAYLAAQAERAEFQQNAIRRIVLAALDLDLLLSPEQRRYAESRLNRQDLDLSPNEWYRSLVRSLDRERFTAWQNARLELLVAERERN